MEIALIGAGNIARVIAEHAQDYKIRCVYDSVAEAAESFSVKYGCEVRLPEKFPNVDLVVEAASQEAVKQYGELILNSGQNLMIMSVGALVDHGLLERLKKAAEAKKVKIIIPSGAVAGLDGLRSAAIGEVDEVALTTTKPPKGFDIETDEAKTIFTGDAGEAVKKYPKNVNVAATLSLAGIGFDKTKVKLVADPNATDNRHEIFVRGDFGDMTIKLNNLPSPDNPKTSYLAAMSAVAAIRKFGESIVIG